MPTCINCGQNETKSAWYCGDCILRAAQGVRLKDPPGAKKTKRGLKSGAVPRKREHAFQQSSNARPSPQSREGQWEAILDVVRQEGEVTRDRLQEVTRIPINVVTPRVRELIDGGQLIEGDYGETRLGNKARLLMLPYGPARTRGRSGQPGLYLLDPGDEEVAS